MLYVVDTHVLVWYFTGNKRLRSRLKDTIEETRSIGGHLLVPTIVLAEAFYIHLKHPELLDYHTMHRHIVDDPSFEIADFTVDILERMVEVKGIGELHDRIIVATAQNFKTGILTVSFGSPEKWRTCEFNQQRNIPLRGQKNAAPKARRTACNRDAGATQTFDAGSRTLYERPGTQ